MDKFYYVIDELNDSTKRPSPRVSKNRKKLPTPFSHTMKPLEQDGKNRFSKY